MKEEITFEAMPKAIAYLITKVEDLEKATFCIKALPYKNKNNGRKD
jgi:hypothetical protein